MAGDLKGLASVMRNTFYLAVGISPLVVIHPKKLDLDGIRRDYLIAVCRPSFFPLFFILFDHLISYAL
jgi:hypothetical protein